MSLNRPARVMVIDDNRLAAEALERWFDTSPQLAWAGWTADPAAVADLIQAGRPDVILLDVEIPGVDSFEVLARIKATNPLLPVVMFSGHIRADYIERAFDLGSSGYIVKDEAVTDISALLLRAAAGDIVLSPLASHALRDAPHA